MQSSEIGEWSNIRETIVMLYLSTAQVESSLREGTVAIFQLADSMMAIAKSSQEIANSIERMADSPDNHDLDLMRNSAQEISEQVKQSVVAHQFHDRITQRLEHVTSSLGKLCHLISEPTKYSDPKEWRRLQGEIRDSYTMEAERLMFEHIMMGVSVDEALEIYHHNFNDVAQDDNTDDDIELF